MLLAAARDGYPSVLAEAGLPELRLAGLDDADSRQPCSTWPLPSFRFGTRTRVLREAAGNPLAHPRAAGCRRPA